MLLRKKFCFDRHPLGALGTTKLDKVCLFLPPHKTHCVLPCFFYCYVEFSLSLYNILLAILLSSMCQFVLLRLLYASRSYSEKKTCEVTSPKGQIVTRLYNDLRTSSNYSKNKAKHSVFCGVAKADKPCQVLWSLGPQGGVGRKFFFSE